MEKCSVCSKEFENEAPAILTIGAYGNPRYLCDECALDLDIATCEKEFDKISFAIEKIGKKMVTSSPDKKTYDTVKEILSSAGERAKRIKEGNYDFSLDEEEEDREELFDEIPEELKETEEDKRLDRIDEERNRKFDKIYNSFTIGMIIGCILFIVWKVIDVFLI